MPDGRGNFSENGQRSSWDPSAVGQRYRPRRKPRRPNSFSKTRIARRLKGKASSSDLRSNKGTYGNSQHLISGTRCSAISPKSKCPEGQSDRVPWEGADELDWSRSRCKIQVPATTDCHLLDHMRHDCPACLKVNKTWKKSVQKESRKKSYDQYVEPKKPQRSVPKMPAIEQSFEDEDEEELYICDHASPSKPRTSFFSWLNRKRSLSPSWGRLASGNSLPSPKVDWWFGNDNDKANGDNQYAQKPRDVSDNENQKDLDQSNKFYFVKMKENNKSKREENLENDDSSERISNHENRTEYRSEESFNEGFNDDDYDLEYKTKWINNQSNNRTKNKKYSDCSNNLKYTDCPVETYIQRGRTKSKKDLFEEFSKRHHNTRTPRCMEYSIKCQTGISSPPIRITSPPTRISNWDGRIGDRNANYDDVDVTSPVRVLKDVPTAKMKTEFCKKREKRFPCRSNFTSNALGSPSRRQYGSPGRQYFVKHIRSVHSKIAQNISENRKRSESRTRCRPFCPSERVLNESRPQTEDQWAKRHLSLLHECNMESHATAKERLRRLARKAKTLRGSIQDMALNFGNIEERLNKLESMHQNYKTKADEVYRNVSNNMKTLKGKPADEKSEQSPNIIKSPKKHDSTTTEDSCNEYRLNRILRKNFQTDLNIADQEDDKLDDEENIYKLIQPENEVYEINASPDFRTTNKKSPPDSEKSSDLFSPIAKRDTCPMLNDLPATSSSTSLKSTGTNFHSLSKVNSSELNTKDISPIRSSKDKSKPLCKKPPRPTCRGSQKDVDQDFLSKNNNCSRKYSPIRFIPPNGSRINTNESNKQSYCIIDPVLQFENQSSTFVSSDDDLNYRVNKITSSNTNISSIYRNQNYKNKEKMYNYTIETNRNKSNLTNSISDIQKNCLSANKTFTVDDKTWNGVSEKDKTKHTSNCCRVNSCQDSRAPRSRKSDTSSNSLRSKQDLLLSCKNSACDTLVFRNTCTNAKENEEKQRFQSTKNKNGSKGDKKDYIIDTVDCTDKHLNNPQDGIQPFCSIHTPHGYDVRLFEKENDESVDIYANQSKGEDEAGKVCSNRKSSDTSGFVEDSSRSKNCRKCNKPKRCSSNKCKSLNKPTSKKKLNECLRDSKRSCNSCKDTNASCTDCREKNNCCCSRCENPCNGMKCSVMNKVSSRIQAKKDQLLLQNPRCMDTAFCSSRPDKTGYMNTISRQIGSMGGQRPSVFGACCINASRRHCSNCQPAGIKTVEDIGRKDSCLISLDRSLSKLKRRTSSRLTEAKQSFRRMSAALCLDSSSSDSCSSSGSDCDSDTGGCEDPCDSPESCTSFEEEYAELYEKIRCMMKKYKKNLSECSDQRDSCLLPESRDNCQKCASGKNRRSSHRGKSSPKRERYKINYGNRNQEVPIFKSNFRNNGSSKMDFGGSSSRKSRSKTPKTISPLRKVSHSASRESSVCLPCQQGRKRSSKDSVIFSKHSNFTRNSTNENWGNRNVSTSNSADKNILNPKRAFYSPETQNTLDKNKLRKMHRKMKAILSDIAQNRVQTKSRHSGPRCRSNLDLHEGESKHISSERHKNCDEFSSESEDCVKHRFPNESISDIYAFQTCSKSGEERHFASRNKSKPNCHYRYKKTILKDMDNRMNNKYKLEENDNLPSPKKRKTSRDSKIREKIEKILARDIDENEYRQIEENYSGTQLDKEGEYLSSQRHQPYFKKSSQMINKALFEDRSRNPCEMKNNSRVLKRNTNSETDKSKISSRFSNNPIVEDNIAKILNKYGLTVSEGRKPYNNRPDVSLIESQSNDEFTESDESNVKYNKQQQVITRPYKRNVREIDALNTTSNFSKSGCFKRKAHNAAKPINKKFENPRTQECEYFDVEYDSNESVLSFKKKSSQSPSFDLVCGKTSTPKSHNRPNSKYFDDSEDFEASRSESSIHSVSDTGLNRDVFDESLNMSRNRDRQNMRTSKFKYRNHVKQRDRKLGKYCDYNHSSSEDNYRHSRDRSRNRGKRKSNQNMNENYSDDNSCHSFAKTNRYRNQKREHLKQNSRFENESCYERSDGDEYKAKPSRRKNGIEHIDTDNDHYIRSSKKKSPTREFDRGRKTRNRIVCVLNDCGNGKQTVNKRSTSADFIYSKRPMNSKKSNYRHGSYDRMSEDTSFIRRLRQKSEFNNNNAPYSNKVLSKEAHETINFSQDDKISNGDVSIINLKSAAASFSQSEIYDNANETCVKDECIDSYDETSRQGTISPYLNQNIKSETNDRHKIKTINLGNSCPNQAQRTKETSCNRIFHEKYNPLTARSSLEKEDTLDNRCLNSTEIIRRQQNYNLFYNQHDSEKDKLKNKFNNPTKGKSNFQACGNSNFSDSKRKEPKYCNSGSHYLYGQNSNDFQTLFKTERPLDYSDSKHQIFDNGTRHLYNNGEKICDNSTRLSQNTVGQSSTLCINGFQEEHTFNTIRNRSNAFSNSHIFCPRTNRLNPYRRNSGYFSSGYASEQSYVD